MGYDLSPTNEGVASLHLGAFSWGHVIDACGFLWTYKSNGPQYYVTAMEEEREYERWNEETDDGYVRETTHFPYVGSNDGFIVTEEEARIMARCVRNFVRWQKEVNADPEVVANIEKHKSPEFHRAGLKAWPTLMREDWLERFWEFADWAETSGGFAIH